MLTAAQHAIRRTGITSTDITRILEESPFGGPCDVYREKVLEGDDVPDRKAPTIQMRIGNYLEPLVLELIAEEFGLQLSKGATVRNPTQPWAIATPDGFVGAPSAGKGVAEAKVKTVLFQDRNLWTQEDAPPSFVHIQAQWHMVVDRAPVCYVGALLGAQPRFWIVEDDPALASGLLEAGHDFHERHVLARVPPPADGSEGARRMLKALWPKSKAATLKASPDAEELARKYFEAHKAVQRAGDDKEVAAQGLLEIARDFERVEGDGWRLLLSERRAATVPSYERKAYRHFDLRAVSR